MLVSEPRRNTHGRGLRALCEGCSWYELNVSVSSADEALAQTLDNATELVPDMEDAYSQIDPQSKLQIDVQAAAAPPVFETEIYIWGIDRCAPSCDGVPAAAPPPHRSGNAILIAAGTLLVATFLGTVLFACWCRRRRSKAFASGPDTFSLTEMELSDFMLDTQPVVIERRAPGGSAKSIEQGGASYSIVASWNGHEVAITHVPLGFEEAQAHAMGKSMHEAIQLTRLCHENVVRCFGRQVTMHESITWHALAGRTEHIGEFRGCG